MARASQTRTRILDIAQDAVLAKGFEATSIDEIVAGAEITKSGFFYHFRDKNALARALLERYIEDEDRLFDDLWARARELNDDPLHATLIALKLLAELFADLPGAHPGCLVAATTYQDRLFDARVSQLNRNAFLSWRNRFRSVFEDIAKRYPPREDIDIEVLADTFSTVCEGGIVIGRALGDSKVLADQLLLFRSFVKQTFAPAAA